MTFAELMNKRRAEIPEGFVATSDGPGWRGKWKCAHCNAQGWPGPDRDGYHNDKWWGLKHGTKCRRANA